MKKYMFVICCLFSLCISCFGSISVTAPSASSVDQYGTVSVNWASDDVADGALVSIILQQSGSPVSTLATGQANIVGVNSFSWTVSQGPGSNYSIQVISESDGSVFDDSSIFSIVAPTVSVSTSNINQFDDLDVSWSVSGVISNDVNLSIAENGETASVTGGSTTYSFSTDNTGTWSPGTYTLTATSADQSSISDSTTFVVSASAISSVSVGDVNQFDTLNVSWVETGTIGSTVTVTAVNGGVTKTMSVASGVGSASFSTDETWTAGTYTVAVKSDDHVAISGSDTCVVTASTITSVNAGDVNQFETLTVSWTEAGTIGSTVTVTAVNGGVTKTTSVASGVGSASFSTDETWTAGTYTVTVKSDDHVAISGSDTCVVTASTITTVNAGDVNQFETLTVSWTEAGTIGSTVTVTAVNGGVTKTMSVASGVGSASFSTDETWTAGTYTVTVKSDDHAAISGSDTCVVTASTITTVNAGDVNQFDTLTVSWTEAGTIGSTVTVTAVNGGVTKTSSVASGVGSASFSTDETWTAGTYTVTVKSDDHVAISGSDTCVVTASTITTVNAGDVNQFDALNVSWTEAGTIGSTVTVTAVNGGITKTTSVASGVGSASFSTDETWTAGTYTVTVKSDDHVAISGNNTCVVTASTISSVSASNLNQFDTLTVSWLEAGSIGSNVTVTVANGGFNDSATVASGTLSASFATDETWPAGTYTVTVASVDHGSISGSYSSCVLTASSISAVAATDVNQFDTLTVSWTEAGTIGSGVTVTAVSGGVTKTTSVASGVGSASFSTDETWTAGTYTVTVKSDDHAVLTANNTCVVSASSISTVSAADVNQFDTLAVSWTEAGTIGSGGVTVTAVNGGVTKTISVASGVGSASIATDKTWTAGTYTVTITSNDHAVLNANDTCVVSVSEISGISASAINQYDNLVISWAETGTLGAQVEVKVSQGAFSQTATVATGTLTYTFTTDHTWPTGSCTITITPVSFPTAAETSTVTINPTAVSLNAITDINQYDTLNISWTETGTIGANTTVTVTNAGFTRTSTVSTGTLSTSFTTDQSWPAGSYTVVVSLDDHTSVTSSGGFTLTATSVTLAAPANINQYDNISLSWTETGSVGTTVDVVVKLGGTSVATGQVAAGTGSWTIATDETWTVGTYTVELTLTDHSLITDSDTFALALTDVALAAVSNINQYDNINMSWSYSGSYGSNVTVEIVRQSDMAVVSSQTIAATNMTATIATDISATWPAGNYTAIVTLADHTARSASRSFTVSQTAVTAAVGSADGGAVNQLDTLALTWSSTGSVGNVSLAIYNAGSLAYTIAADTTNDGSQSWQIPLSFTVGTGYYLRVASKDHPLVFKDAALTFDVNVTSITVNAVSDITQFDNLTVNWSTLGSVGSTVSISVISAANGTIDSVAGYSAAAGMYTFSSDLSWNAASDYYVKIVSDLHTVCYGQSSGNFTVNPTAVTINALSNINQLDSQTITWNKVGNFGTNTIFELYVGGSRIIQQTLATNSYTINTNMSWAVGTYSVKVISQDHSTCFATDTFVLNPTTIHLTDPVENCYWRKGAQQKIAWDAVGFAGSTLTVNLYQSGTLVTTATASANNASELYTWTVPTGLSTGTYNVKLISNADVNLTSQYSADITITDNAFGGYIYTNSSDKYGTSVANVEVEVSGASGTMVLVTNGVGYWSTPNLALGDYAITPSLTRRWFEKAVAPGAGQKSYTYTLDSTNLSGSCSLDFLSGYKVVFITPAGAGSGSGLSWANAGNDIQAAIDQAAADPDDRYEEVWVKKGSYTGPFTLADNCYIYGSFNGVEDPATFNLSKRDFINNPSTVAGDGGSGHIIDGSDTTGAAIFNGFIVSGNSSAVGAGLYVENSTGLIVGNCTFYKNATTNVGGAIGCLNSILTVENCLFQGNTSNNSGGAIYAAAGSTVNINGSTFSGNFAPWLGSAIFGKNNSVISIRSCTVASGFSYGGSAVEVENSSTLNISNSILYYNSNFAGEVTAAQYQCDSSSGTLVSNCYIQGVSGAAPDFFDVPNSMNGTWGDGDDDYGDLHLRVSSPCIDSGSGSGPGAYDRDGDLRVAGLRLDIGSDECHFESSTVASGGSVTLTPIGDGTAEMYDETYITLDNTAGANNSTIDVVQISDNIHPEENAYRVIGSTVVVETSLADGDYEMTLVIPFTVDDLAGATWNTVTLSYFDESSQSWSSAGTGTNWQEQSTAPTMVQLRARPLGDYGVYWNSIKQKGFAWANVNHTTDFAPLIYTRDFDFDRNGIVDVLDLTELVYCWQVNNEEDSWEVMYDISEIKDGKIDLNDFRVLAINWLQ